MPRDIRLGGQTRADLTFNTALATSPNVETVRDVKKILREIGAITPAEAWNQTGLTIDGVDADEKTGGAVSLSGDGTTVAIGVPKHDGRTGDVAGDQCGEAVSLSANGQRLSVGARYYDSQAGLVRVFDLK